MQRRPKGLLPRGTALGFVGLILLGGGIPLIAMGFAAPVTPGADDNAVIAFPISFVLGALPTLVMMFGLRSRANWMVRLFFYSCATMLLAFGVTILFGIACVLGLIPTRDAGWTSFTIVAAVLTVFLAPFAWFLWQALRLRYWQPGSTPDQWELGDETAPAWAAWVLPSSRPRND